MHAPNFAEPLAALRGGRKIPFDEVVSIRERFRDRERHRATKTTKAVLGALVSREVVQSLPLDIIRMLGLGLVDYARSHAAHRVACGEHDLEA